MGSRKGSDERNIILMSVEDSRGLLEELCKSTMLLLSSR